MPDRIIFQGGANPRFRVSKPGKDVSSTNMEDFILHENMSSYAPKVAGSVSFSGSGTIDVTIPNAPSRAPFVMLKSSDGRMMGINEFYGAILTNRTTLRIKNRQNIARVITYFIFENRFEPT